MDCLNLDLVNTAKQLLVEKYEPIAIIGAGLRLSGGIFDLKGFHRLLYEGQDNIIPIPMSRWDNRSYFKSLLDPNNLICTNEGGYLQDIDKFDPAFFSISPKEAHYMDPQQRIMLEICWHALENSGLNPNELRGGDGSVYLGTSSLDYAREMMGLAEPQLFSKLGTGTANSAISGRIAYFLGWRGPCLTVDTACSSSLVAMHLAVTALRNQETSIAIAGGINIIHNPISHIIFTRANMLAPDGRCKTFDEAADGYGRSEGAAVLVLRRLSDALADCNRVLAVIRGTAVRQDGESGGLTVPNGRAQEAVMREALKSSLLTPSDISYVEAHGTGTPLGDPIELHSINSLFSERIDTNQIVYVASSKTNLGHMEAAAGIGGVLKCLAQLNHKLIYPHIHFKTPSSKIDWNSLNVKVPTAVYPWTQPVCRALVNSFGFSGTIASVVLEQAPAKKVRTVTKERMVRSDPLIATVSAKSPISLIHNLQAHLAALEASPTVDIQSYVWAASVERQHHFYRWAAPVYDRDGLVKAMCGVLAEPKTTMTNAEKNQLFTDSRVVFLITGQGAQYAGMGAKLYHCNQIFRQALDEVARQFDAILNVKILDLMFDKEPQAMDLLKQTKYTQPALFAFNYAVSRMWIAYGIQPAILLGHSIGEIVSACLAGLFSLEDAIRMTVRRAALMQAVTQEGAMMAVKASRDTLTTYIEPFDNVDFGCFNGPMQTVLSGGRTALETVAQHLLAEDIPHYWLDVSHAFHSSYMQDAADDFREFMHTVTFHPPQLEFISNVTGKAADYEMVSSPDYWSHQICKPVNFRTGLETIAARGSHIFLETGPSPHLVAIGRNCVTAEKHCWIATIDQTLSEENSLEQAIISLYGAGRELNWRVIHAVAVGDPCDLPAYVFDHKSFWLPKASSDATYKHFNAHPLLGRLETYQRNHWTYISQITSKSPSYLADHVVMGRTIFPGTGYVEIVLALQDAVLGHTGMIIEDLEIHEPLLLSDDNVIELSIHLTRPNHHIYQVEIRSHLQNQSRTHFTCRLLDDITLVPSANLPFSPQQDNKISFNKFLLYDKLALSGLQYGPQFQRVESIQKEGARYVVGSLSTENIQSWEILSPGIFDGMLQMLEPLLDANRTMVPVGWSKVRLWRKPRGTVFCTAKVHDDCDPFGSEVRVDLAMYSDEQLILCAEGLRLHEIKSREHFSAPFFYRLIWQEDTLTSQEILERGALAINCPENLHSHLAPYMSLIAGPKQVLKTICNSTSTQRHRIRIIWFWNAPNLPPKADTEAVMRACQTFYEPLIQFIKAIEQHIPDGIVQLCLVTQGAQTTESFSNKSELPSQVSLNTQLQATVSGFCAVLNTEFSRIRAKVVDLPSTCSEQELTLSLLNELYLSDSRADTQVAYRGQTRLVRRLAEVKIAENENNFRLTASENGLLSGLQTQSVERTVPIGDEIEVRIEAAGVNFKDVLNALSLLKKYKQNLRLPYKELPLGFEGAGVVVAAGDQADFKVGELVMISHIGCMQRYVTVSSRAAVSIPPGISFEQAAAIPTAFITSYYALYRLAKINAFDRVLVHAAAGGVGQAALQLCRRVGAEVFATASRHKWDMLREQGVTHIMDSRSTNFVEEIRCLTDGQGVSVVLNSLNKDFIRAGLSATSHGGRFVEIGKLDVWSTQQVAAVRPDISYSQFDLSEMPEDELLDINKAILEEVARFLTNKEIFPLPVKCYSVEESAEAFSVLARGENVGKIVLNFGKVQDSDLTLSRNIRANGTYLITGGYGALGQQTAKWLIQSGADHLVLLGRHLPEQDVLKQIQARLTKAKSLDLLVGDVADATVINRIFTEAADKGRPVCGVVHLAGLIFDKPIMEQSWEAFRNVFLPKVVGTWNLWQAVESQGGIELFVGYSSTASVIGSVSQSNYAAANAFIDGLMNRYWNGRRIGLSINWGPWASIGMAAELTDQQQKIIRRRGILPIPLQRGMEAFGRLATLAQGQIMVGEVDWVKYKDNLPAYDALYDAFGEIECSNLSEEFDLKQLLKLAPEQRNDAVVDEVLNTLRQLLQYSKNDRISRRSTFAELGIDSLVAVEFRNSLEKSFKLALPSSLVFDYPSIAVLSRHLLNQITNITRPEIAEQ